MRNVKYFDKETLITAAMIAEERNYNRQIEHKYLEELDDSIKFPVTFSMLHEHAGGELVDPHVRAMIVLGVDGYQESFTVMLDVDMDLFNGLPSVALPTKDDEKVEP